MNATVTSALDKMSETPKKTAFENAVGMIDPSERLTKDQMLELYRLSYCSPGLTDEWKARGLEIVALSDLKVALNSLRYGNVSCYQKGQIIMLALIFRQKRQNGEIKVEEGKDSSDFLPILREALLTQEHGFEYYLNGGLFND